MRIDDIDNALQLILMFRLHKAIRLTEASKALGVAPSAAHRLLAMVQHRIDVRREESGEEVDGGPRSARTSTRARCGLRSLRGSDLRELQRSRVDLVDVRARKSGERCFNRATNPPGA